MIFDLNVRGWKVWMGERQRKAKEKKRGLSRKKGKKRYKKAEKGSIFIKDFWERNSQVGAKILIIEVKESKKKEISRVRI